VFFIATFIGTSDHRPGLQDFLYQIRMAALRTLFIDRLPVGSKVALGILRAAVEKVAAAGFLFHQLAFLALWAFHADEVLLDVLALRISAARGELAKTPVAQHHVPLALGTFFFQRNVGEFLSLVQPPRSFALRISGAGHELAKAAALQHHGAPAILAILLL